MAKRKLKFEDGRSKKFWKIQLKGTTQTVTYGRLGTAGRTLVTDFATATEARKSYDRLVRQKLGKGYVDTSTNTIAANRTRNVVDSNSAGTTRDNSTRILLNSIYCDAERLGANISQIRGLPKSVKRCPAFIAEFYQNIQWPKNRQYDAPTLGFEGLHGISFYGPIQQVPAAVLEGIHGCDGMDLYAVGFHGGDGWILLLDGNDKNTLDPIVYALDHAPEPGDEIDEFGRLSKFLKKMKPAEI